MKKAYSLQAMTGTLARVIIRRLLILLISLGVAHLSACSQFLDQNKVKVASAAAGSGGTGPQTNPGTDAVKMGDDNLMTSLSKEIVKNKTPDQQKTDQAAAQSVIAVESQILGVPPPTPGSVSALDSNMMPTEATPTELATTTPEAVPAEVAGTSASDGSVEADPLLPPTPVSVGTVTPTTSSTTPATPTPTANTGTAATATNPVLQVEVAQQANNQNTTTVLTGPYVQGQQYMNLGPDSKNTFTATYRCNDASPATNHCETGILNLQSMGTDQAQIVAVIRQTAATAKMDTFTTGATPSADYQRVTSIFAQSKDYLSGGTGIQMTQVDSAEVVNGITFIRITFITYDNQMISLLGALSMVQTTDPASGKTSSQLTGNLVADTQFPALNLVDRSRTLKNDVVKLIQTAQIVDVRSNTDLKLVLTVNGGQTGDSQSISVDIARNFTQVKKPSKGKPAPGPGQRPRPRQNGQPPAAVPSQSQQQPLQQVPLQ